MSNPRYPGRSPLCNTIIFFSCILPICFLFLLKGGWRDGYFLYGTGALTVFFIARLLNFALISSENKYNSRWYHPILIGFIWLLYLLALPVSLIFCALAPLRQKPIPTAEERRFDYLQNKALKEGHTADYYQLFPPCDDADEYDDEYIDEIEEATISTDLNDFLSKREKDSYDEFIYYNRINAPDEQTLRFGFSIYSLILDLNIKYIDTGVFDVESCRYDDILFNFNSLLLAFAQHTLKDDIVIKSVKKRMFYDLNTENNIAMFDETISLYLNSIACKNDPLNFVLSNYFNSTGLSDTIEHRNVITSILKDEHSGLEYLKESDLNRLHVKEQP